MNNNGKKPKVFIDGESGTVGLMIYERLENRDDIELLKIDPELSENADERKKFLNQADFVFLCLPDDAARESVSLIENENVRIIDASTAHRINPDWDYGFPELSPEHEEKIRVSKRVAVPGCYASGFIALVYPLVKAGVIPKDYPVTCFGISGYSGGGRVTIADYENENRSPELNGARLYALNQKHKHLPEMKKHAGLSYTPLFAPVIDDYYNGMIVCVPLQGLTLPDTNDIEDFISVYKSHYGKSGRVKVIEEYSEPFLAANALGGSDDMEIFVLGINDDDFMPFGTNERFLLVARFDNLGKGASGAAVQCFNLMQNAEIMQK